MDSPVYLYTLRCDKHPSSVNNVCTCVSRSHVPAYSLKDKGSKTLHATFNTDYFFLKGKLRRHTLR